MSTRVVAIRHAKPLNEGYADDSLRPLSEEGKEIQRRMTEQLKAEGIEPTLILTSPFLRAQQTAQIVTDVFGIPYNDEPALGNDFDALIILDRIPEPDKNATVFFIGHAPTLENFVNDLVGETVLPNGLSKSSAAVIDFDERVAFGEGKFINYYRP